MTRDTWKKFEENEPTHSTAHHLMAIHQLLSQQGYARGVDVARHLNISRASVSIMLGKLRKQGYLEEDENKFVRLTGSGRTLAEQISINRRVLTRFLGGCLHLPPEEAEVNACKIEHLISDEVQSRLISAVALFLSEQPAARAFREALASFHFECDPSGKCPVCQTQCLFGNPGE